MNLIKYDFTKFDFFLFKIKMFFEDWIYPGNFMKNFLFYRYDLIKLPAIKAYEYIDIKDRLFLANMELIKSFIEDENPEKHICWYKDEDGVDCGHHYGECKTYKVYFPELKDVYIMDIIKSIYKWYTIDYPSLLSDYDYILDIWSKYFSELRYDEIEDNEDMYEVYTYEISYSVEDLNNLNLNWDILFRYFKTKDELIEHNAVYQKMRDLEKRIFEEKQYNLHLCIEVRPYLWV